MGVGKKRRGGLEAERPETERETEEQWETDLLQDSCSLSGACSQQICSRFFALVIIWPQGRVQEQEEQATPLLKLRHRADSQANNCCAATLKYLASFEGMANFEQLLLLFTGTNNV